MLHALPEYRGLFKREFEVSDITMGLGLRLHEGNPWLLDNLKLQLEHYRPGPRMVVVDQGSAPAAADSVRRLTEAAGAKYIRDDYQGLYSPGRARNLAAAAAETDFIFSTDPDCFAVSDLFQRLISLINATGLSTQLDLMLNLPAYHLSREGASGFRAAGDSVARSAALESIRMKTIFGETTLTEFVAPYSNVYLCRRDGFSLAGGYDESFAGHGSEDFEFLLRYALIMGRYPIPAWPVSDIHRPSSESFFHQHEYEGFRALFSAMSFPAESSGLATFHLNHPIEAGSDWQTKGDHRRHIFRARVEPYLKDKRALIDRDWMPRPKQLLALSGAESQSALWLAFRLAGYRPHMVTEAEAPSLNLKSVGWEGVEAVAAFQSDLRRLPAFDAIRREAEKRGMEFITVDHGLVADSWICRSNRGPADLKNDLSPSEAAAVRALTEKAGEQFLNPDEAWSVLREHSLEHQGVIYQFSLNGRRIWAYDRLTFQPRIGPQAYMLTRLSLLSKKQWRFLSKTGRISTPQPLLAQSPTVRSLALAAEATILKCLLSRQPKKLDKYLHNRALFFLDSRRALPAFYHKVWRRIFGE